MFNVRQISDDFYYVGGNDRRLELFENAYPIPDGISYNSYLLVDDKFYGAIDYIPVMIVATYFNCLATFLGGILTAYKDTKGAWCRS